MEQWDALEEGMEGRVTADAEVAGINTPSLASSPFEAWMNVHNFTSDYGRLQH